MITVRFTTDEELGRVFKGTSTGPPLVEVPLRLYLPMVQATDEMQARIEKAVEKMVKELNESQ